MKTLISKSSYRLRELDFLRGIAIILVLFRHSKINDFLVNMGWIGVDLFFVLSGFLVSSLLFKEYRLTGALDAKRFLIRRGFKIYPLYYITFVIYFVFSEKHAFSHLLADLIFMQNYFSGWGYLYSASWTLAVEEHFYFALVCLILFLGIKTSWLKIKRNNKKQIDYFVIFVCCVLVVCLILRIYSNIYLPSQDAKNFTMTHLRIDSLMSGVLIAYLLIYKKKSFSVFFVTHKCKLIIIAILCSIWTPFIDPLPSLFVKTIGFSLVYITFSILLIFFLLNPLINIRLSVLFGDFFVNAISKIGFCSYSIYIIHTLVIRGVNYTFNEMNYILDPYFNFIFVFIISVLLGFFMTYKIERWFLDKRNQYFPSKSIKAN
ncbi:acyltransferase family protein [Bizionia sp.]|uniref:acyltransferase family protein n=1 Tax=Bizionia sp. TaxID=1954480 RepID=UPI003A8CD2DE